MRRIKRIIALEENLKLLEVENKRLQNRIDFIYDSVLCGADVHMKSDSWAVVCLNGKTDYVNFIRLPHRDIEYIKHFLRQFNNRIVDAPMFLGDYL